MVRSQEIRDALVAEFGSTFARDWGWAAGVIDDPTFRKIEAATNLDHLRPLYKMASHAVHPSIRGSFFDLGGLKGSGVLVAGPSIYGFTDPADSACLSLHQATVALLNLRPEPRNLVVLIALGELRGQVEETFLSIQLQQERELGEPQKNGPGSTNGSRRRLQRRGRRGVVHGASIVRALHAVRQRLGLP